MHPSPRVSGYRETARSTSDLVRDGQSRARSHVFGRRPEPELPPLLGRAPRAEPRLPSRVARPLEAKLGGAGQPLDPETGRFLESRFGRDFSSVRVHTDQLAQASAQSHGALAYTVGSDIAFAPGAYAPRTPHGLHLLAHELVHTIQQRDATPSAADTGPWPPLLMEPDQQPSRGPSGRSSATPCCSARRRPQPPPRPLPPRLQPR